MSLYRFLFRDRLFGYFSLGAFSLSFISEVGLLMSNSLIVNRLGAPEYATLYFWAILGSMIFYVVFSAFRESAIRLLYGFGLLSLSAVSLWHFHFANSEPSLRAFVIHFLLVDFIGPNVFSGVLIAQTSPTVFREVFQRVLSVQLFSRILAAFSMAGLSRLGWADAAQYLFWVFLTLHFFCLIKVLLLSRESKEAVEVKPSLSRMKDSFSFLFSNHFIRLVLYISILANVLRVLIDYIYLQKVGAYGLQPDRVTTFLSTVSLGTIICVYLFQRIIGKRLVLTKNLGMLYSLQPVGVILLGLGVVMVPGLAFAAGMMIFAQCTGRGIQLPLFRQSMVALPKNLRSSVMFILSIFLSASGLVTSALLSLGKNQLELNAFVLVLMSVCVLFLIVSTRLDSFYVRNLWSSYKEMKEGQWLERRVGQSHSPFHLVTQMSMLELEDPQQDSPFEFEREVVPASVANVLREDHNPLKRLSGLLRTAPRDPEIKGLLNFCLSNDRISTSTKRILIRRVYEACYDKDVLRLASEFHRFLLMSEDAKEILEGIRLAEALGIRRMRRLLGVHLESKDALVAQAAQMALATESFMEALPTKKLSTVTLRKLRSVARDYIELGDEAKLFTKLEWLLSHESEKRVRAVIDTLYHPKFTMARQHVLLCIDSKKGVFSISPLIQQMFNLDYLDAQEIRWVLRRLGFGHEKDQIFAEVNRGLSKLIERNFNVWDSVQFNDRRLQNLFLHSLFLEEWVDTMYKSVSYFTHTIKDMVNSDEQQKEMLSSIHLEYLKKNVSYPIWSVLLSKNVSSKQLLAAKKELTRLMVSAS